MDTNTKKITVYRVCTTSGVGEGIWYDQLGKQKNLGFPAHSFYHDPDFEMQFAKECVGYISVTKTLKDLLNWFTVEDVKKLESLGYYVTEFETAHIKQYEYECGKFHIVADKKTMKRKRLISLEEYERLTSGGAIC